MNILLKAHSSMRNALLIVLQDEHNKSETFLFRDESSVNLTPHKSVK